MQQVTMPLIGTDRAWRDTARALLAENVPPHAVMWSDQTAAPALWDDPPPKLSGRAVTVPKGFVNLANSVVWHTDVGRFDLLYRVLWRLRTERHLMADRADADLVALHRMAKNVHRCQHKMKAFLRFRDVGLPGDARRSFAAWFEPTYHTAEPTASFFARRFGDMDWRIFTPELTVLFVDGKLSFGSGQSKPQLPDDASEQLWTTYFRNIFNPARLKVKAMQSEMPKKYWKNMPEAAAIPDLIASAPERVRQMAEAAPSLPPPHASKVQAQLDAFKTAWRGSPDALLSAMSACTRCDLHCNATQTVVGEGPRDARLMIVGEQPGDTEDLAGRPFVGPAGKMLDRLMERAGVERDTVYLTNAVKHFKFRAQGRRRIHQRPNRTEIERCKWWLDAERAMVRPKVILSLGATPALALTRDGGNLTKRRGKVLRLEDGTQLILSFHPSYLLRLHDPNQRAIAEDALRSDLAFAHYLCSQQT